MDSEHVYSLLSDYALGLLSPDERRRTRAIHVDSDTRGDLVTVSFATP